jgi:hypothetical protein
MVCEHDCLRVLSHLLSIKLKNCFIWRVVCDCLAACFNSSRFLDSNSDLEIGNLLEDKRNTEVALWLLEKPAL